MQSKIKSRTVEKSELSQYLLTNLNVFELADELSEFILNKEELQPIPLTQEEYDRVVSMFRVRGQRMVDGNIIAETRGRKPSTKIDR